MKLTDSKNTNKVDEDSEFLDNTFMFNYWSSCVLEYPIQMNFPVFGTFSSHISYMFLFCQNPLKTMYNSFSSSMATSQKRESKEKRTQLFISRNLLSTSPNNYYFLFLFLSFFEMSSSRNFDLEYDDYKERRNAAGIGSHASSRNGRFKPIDVEKEKAKKEIGDYGL